MKAFIDFEGYLRIESENVLEGYALKKWLEENVFSEKCECKCCANMAFLASAHEKEGTNDR